MDAYIFQALLGLVILAAIMFGAKYFHRKMLLSGRSGYGRSRYMRSVDKLPLSNDKWLEIIEIGDDKIIIGITQQSINVLKTLGKEELKDVEIEKGKGIFAEMFDRYAGKK